MRHLISSEWFLLLVITALAAVLRFYALGQLPPGLYHDEAYNGLDALRVIGGLRTVFFETNNGREPLFIYLVALSIQCLGRSPVAIRVVAALLGTLTIPATYWMARELLGRREALWSALITAITVWHLNLSRVGFRAVSLPLLTALFLWFFARGLHTRNRLDFGLGGLWLGLAVYSYLPARFAPLPFLMLVLYWLWRRQPIEWRGLLAFFLVALIVASPLLVYAAQHLQTFLGRSAQVSVLNPAINQGNLVGTLIRHIVKTLGMFNWRGDFIPRHNVPYRPVFDPIIGLLFLAGLALSVQRAARQQEYALLCIYFAIMLVPTVLAEDAPHFLRAVGVLPVLFVFPGVALTALGDHLRRRTPSQAVAIVLALLMGLSLCFTVNGYFVQHARSDAAYYNFESGTVELAADINHFIGMGWTEESEWRVPQGLPNAQRLVYVDSRLWRDWASLRFLVPTTASLQVLGENTQPSMSTQEVRIVLWPFEEQHRYLHLLPKERLISVQEGPLERGDLEEQARLLCVTYEASKPKNVPLNIAAQFEQGIQLLGYQIQPVDKGTHLRLFWRAVGSLDADYTVFVHWDRNGQRLAQSDTYPAQGYYPTHLWREGDIVADDHLLAAEMLPSSQDSLAVGLYQLQTMQRLQVIDGTGVAVADTVTLTIP
jgi:4-amino-4-deoxy-L-arabinose transferase-like glycosyltransferase